MIDIWEILYIDSSFILILVRRKWLAFFLVSHHNAGCMVIQEEFVLVYGLGLALYSEARAFHIIIDICEIYFAKKYRKINQ